MADETKTGDATGTTTTTTTPAPAPAAAPPAQVTITAEQYRAFLEAQDRLTKVETDRAAAVEAERQKAVDALAAKGQVEEALRKEREDSAGKVRLSEERAGRVEAELLTERRTSDLNAALLGATFVNEYAAAQVKLLLEGRFEAVRDPATGAIAVREKGTLKPAAEAVKAWLASPEASHQVKAQARGGAGATGGHVPPPAGGGAPAEESVSAALIRLGRAYHTAPPPAVLADLAPGAGGAIASYGLAYRPPSPN